MTERSIVEAAARLRRHGEPHLIATVVATHGATYRRPGARMILTRFRWVAGTVTGGMLEGELSSEGWARTKDAPMLVRFDQTTSPQLEDEDIRSAFGLGGDGAVEVLVERASRPGRIDALEVASRCFRAQVRGAVATVFRSSVAGVAPGARVALVTGGELEDDAVSVDACVRDVIAADLRIALETGVSTTRTYASSRGEIEALIEAITPPPRLFVFGTGHDAVPVAQLAHQVGWEVIVCASLSRHSTRERFATADELLIGTPTELAARVDASHRAIAVVMTHDADRDAETLRMLLGTRVAHIATLPARGDDPQQVALTILAEAQRALDADPARPSTPAIVERPAVSPRPSATFAAVAAL